MSVTDDFTCPICGRDLYATGGTIGAAPNVTNVECIFCKYKGVRVTRSEPPSLIHIYDEDIARYDGNEGCAGAVACVLSVIVLWLLAHFGVI